MSTFGGFARRFRGKPASTNRKIFAASAIIAAIGFFVKLVSLGNASFIARFFGASYQNDCYITAFTVPMILGAIVSGSLNQVLIPTYIEVRENDGEEARNRLFTSVLVWNTTALVVLSALLVVTDRFWLPLLASSFNEEKLHLTSTLLRCMLPIVVIGGFTSMWGAALNAAERFAVVAIGPIMQPSMAIIFMLAFTKHWHIFSPAIGTLAGSLLEALLVGYTLHKTGHPLFPKWFGLTPAIKRVRAQYFACISGSVVLCGTSVVDLMFAGSLGNGSITHLNYGIRIPGVFLSLLQTAAGTAILPMFSKIVAQKDWKGLRHSIRSIAISLFVGSLLVTLVVIALTPLIIKILFQRGEFKAEDAQIVSLVQRLALLGVPITITLIPIHRTFTALRANNILSTVSVGSLALNAIADYVLMKRYGLPGIALATSVWMSFVGVTLFSILYFYLLPKAEQSSVIEVEAALTGPPTPDEIAMLDPFDPIENQVEESALAAIEAGSGDSSDHADASTREIHGPSEL